MQDPDSRYHRLDHIHLPHRSRQAGHKPDKLQLESSSSVRVVESQFGLLQYIPIQHRHRPVMPLHANLIVDGLSSEAGIGLIRKDLPEKVHSAGHTIVGT